MNNKTFIFASFIYFALFLSNSAGRTTRIADTKRKPCRHRLRFLVENNF